MEFLNTNSHNTSIENLTQGVNSCAMAINQSPRNNPSHYSFFTPLATHNKRTSLISKMLTGLECAFSHPKSQFKELQYNDDRQIRSERRSILLDALRVMIYYMDEETHRIGRRISGDRWRDLSLWEIAKYLDIPLLRLKRAFRTLVEKGYIESKKIYKRALDGTYKGIPSIKFITPKLFRDLKIDVEKLFSLKTYRQEQRIKKEEKKYDKSQNSLYIKSLIAKAFQGKMNKGIMLVRNPDDDTPATIYDKQKLIKRAYQMHLDDPINPPSYYLKLISPA